MVDSTVATVVWLVIVVGGGSLWLNAIARNRAPKPAVGSRGDRPVPVTQTPHTNDGSRDEPCGSASAAGPERPATLTRIP